MNTALASFWGPLCALGSSITWAIGSTEYARLSQRHSGFSVNFARALTALPCFALVALLASLFAHHTLFGAGQSAPHGTAWSAALEDFAALRPSHLGWFTLSILSSYAFGDVCLYWSARRLGVPVALTIASTYPLLTAGWGVLFHGERLSALQLAGLLLTVAGVTGVIMAAPKAANSEAVAPSGAHRRELLMGLLFAGMTSVLWAINSYAVTRGGQTVSAPVGNTVRMALALLLCAAMQRVLEPDTRILLPWREYRGMLWVFFVESFGGSYLFMYGLSHSPLAIGATLVSVAPVISVPIAWFLGLERFSAVRTLAVLAAMAGLWLLLGSIY